MKKPTDMSPRKIVAGDRWNFICISLALSLWANLMLVYTGFTWTPKGTCTVTLNPTVEVAPSNKAEESLAQRISAQYNVDTPLPRSVVGFAKAYGRDTFPTYKDILAVIAVESSFNPSAENNGAYGLMQIQFEHHKEKALSPKSLKNPLHNVAIGSSVLKEYYALLRNRDAAILAYQSGPESYIRGEYNPEYLRRFNQARSWLEQKS